MCLEYVAEKEKCKLDDVIHPMVVMSYVKDFAVLHKAVGWKYKDLEGFLRWVPKKNQLLGYNCTNALMAFEALIATYEK